MKRPQWCYVSIAIIILLLLSFSGCGIPREDYETLLNQKTSLEIENTTLKSDLSAIEKDKLTLQTNYDTQTGELNNLKAELETLKSEKEALQSQYDDVNTQLTAVNTVFPPRHFSSSSELETWLAQNSISEKPDTATWEGWYRRAQELQAQALADGYIVSVDYDTSNENAWVYCVTIIDGLIWYWDPETDDITKGASLE